MGLSPFRTCERKKTAAHDHRRDIGAVSDPRSSGTCMRACTPCCQRGDTRAGMSHHSGIDRSVYPAGASTVPRPASWRGTGYFRSSFIPVRKVVQIGARQMGASPLGASSHPRVRSSRNASRYRGLAVLPVAVSKKPRRSRAENRTLHLQRNEACIQVRREMGLHQRKPDGGKTCRATAWIYQTVKTACATDRSWILFSVGPAGSSRETSSGFCRLDWASYQRSVRAAVAGFEPRRRRGLFSTRFRSGKDHAPEDRSFAHEPAIARGSVGIAAPVALHHALQPTEPVSLRLALYQGAASVLAGAVAQDAHQTGSASRGTSRHRLAQLPSHGERLGQGSRSRTGGRKNPTPSREHRYHFGRVWPSGDGRQTANSTAARGICHAPSRGRDSKTCHGMASRHACYHSVTLRDPYLTQILFADFPEVREKNGSSGRTRTYNPPVNSRMLCH